MSKIGEKEIIIPQGVTFELNAKKVIVRGPEGEITLELPGGLTIERVEDKVLVKRNSDAKKVKSIHGLYRSLISNAVVGVEKMWEKRLELVGTGYNVKLEGENLVIKVGYSHPVVFNKVDGIKFQVEGNNKIVVRGFDKHMVGQIAHKIKVIKKPDVYKGKGIRYEGEKLRIKPGKKAKTAGAA